jgi:outer membrane protein OmpA-like peptidoglycan-associated protein
MFTRSVSLVTVLMGCGVLAGQPTQAPNPIQQSSALNASGSMPIYRVTVVARTTKAINYNHRSGATQIGFRGTALMPEARGEARVESKQGVIKIDAQMQKLEPATKYGPEYLTYVMWAITPEGRATNVGEVLLNGTKTHLNATTELQSFGLIVTAEPYFAVTQPSDVVVMENFVTKTTTGTIEEVDAKYELLQRGQYTLNVTPSQIRPVRLDGKTPIELYEARNAVQIARWTGAEKYAADTFLKATQGLQNAEGYLKGKSGKKPIGTVAREAVQMAEDARIITVKKIMAENLANERQAGAERQERAEGERTAAQAETSRVRLEADAAQARSLAEAERVKRETDAQRATARADMDRATREKAEALAQQQAAQAETEAAHRATQEANDLRLKAESEKAALRAQLLQQFSLVLETRDTARGLIVNMSDVLFDTAKYSLRPGAREKLAKVAGIVSGHPGLKLEVEGHTDNVGGDDFNQNLSEQRGVAVRDYLTQQGIAGAAVTTKGFGKTQPVASNDTAAGRQQNRRVELVVSGEIIGMQLGQRASN